MGLAIEDKDGFVKFLIDKKDRKILGCHIIGSQALILMQRLLLFYYYTIVLLLQTRSLTKESISQNIMITLFNYSASEAIV